MKDSKYKCPMCSEYMKLQYNYHNSSNNPIKQVFCFHCGVEYNTKNGRCRVLKESGNYVDISMKKVAIDGRRGVEK